MAVRESGLYPAWRQPRFYPAWRRAQVLPRLAASPGFTPLGGEPSVYPAWRLPRFYPAWRRVQCLPRLAANPVLIPLGGESSVYRAWRRTQYLSRLAGTGQKKRRAAPPSRISEYSSRSPLHHSSLRHRSYLRAPSLGRGWTQMLPDSRLFLQTVLQHTPVTRFLQHLLPRTCLHHKRPARLSADCSPA